VKPKQPHSPHLRGQTGHTRARSPRNTSKAPSLRHHTHNALIMRELRVTHQHFRKRQQSRARASPAEGGSTRLRRMWSDRLRRALTRWRPRYAKCSPRYAGSSCQPLFADDASGRLMAQREGRAPHEEDQIDPAPPDVLRPASPGARAQMTHPAYSWHGETAARGEGDQIVPASPDYEGRRTVTAEAARFARAAPSLCGAARRAAAPPSLDGRGCDRCAAS